MLKVSMAYVALENTLKETDAEAGRWLPLIGIVSREMAEFL